MSIIKKYIREIFLFTCASLVSLGIFFFALEVYVRIQRPGFYDATRLMVPNPYFVKTLTPNLKDLAIHSLQPEFVFKVNSDHTGFRSKKEIAKEKSIKELVRIMCLGDSFTFGYGVEDEEAYPFQINTILQDTYHLPVEIINAGFTGGYSPDTAYVFYKMIGRQFSPDSIILGVFIDTDLNEMGKKNIWDMDESGDIIRVRSLISDTPACMFRSGAINFLYFGASALLKSLRDKAVPDKLVKECLANPQLMPPERIGLDRLVFVLERFKQILDKENITLAVVLIPSYENFCHGELDDMKKVWCTLANVRYDETLRAVEGAHINYSDIKSAFEMKNDASHNQELYYPIDQHWNSAGHKLAAEVIAQWLHEKVLPETSTAAPTP